MTDLIYINLDHRKDREDLMIENWKDVVRLRRFEAIRLPVGRHGNYQSHLAILKLLQKTEAPLTIIGEDDIVPCKDFNERLRVFMKELPKEWDIFMLGFFSNERSQYEKISKHIYRAKNGICASHCYIVNPKSYSKIVDLMENGDYDQSTDVFLLQLQAQGTVHLSIPTFTYQYQSYSDNSKCNDAIVPDGTKVYFSERLENLK